MHCGENRNIKSLFFHEQKKKKVDLTLMDSIELLRSFMAENKKPSKPKVSAEQVKNEHFCNYFSCLQFFELKSNATADVQNAVTDSEFISEDAPEVLRFERTEKFSDKTTNLRRNKFEKTSDSAPTEVFHRCSSAVRTLFFCVRKMGCGNQRKKVKARRSIRNLQIRVRLNENQILAQTR